MSQKQLFETIRSALSAACSPEEIEAVAQSYRQTVRSLHDDPETTDLAQELVNLKEALLRPAQMAASRGKNSS